MDGYVSYLNASYRQPGLTVFSYWNRGEGHADSRRTGQESNYRYNTYHVELQNTFIPFDENSLTWGGSYRYNTINSRILDKGHQQNIGSLFLQDEQSFLEKFNFILGCRYDYNSLLTDTWFSPRGSLVFQIHPDHTLRFSISKAYRDPTFLEAFFDLYSIIDPANPLITTHLFGNDDLNPEKILAYEAGWTAQPTSFPRVRLDLFYNEIKDLIKIIIISNYPFPPFPAREATYFKDQCLLDGGRHRHFQSPVHPLYSSANSSAPDPFHRAFSFLCQSGSVVLYLLGQR